jgi:hypothetical protein
VTPERALDIIAAYGGDSRRWPADDREAVTLLAIADPAVAAALAEARQLDVLLGSWAGDVTPMAPLDAEALIPAPTIVAAPQHRRRAGWWVGGAIAAALTGLIVQAPWTANAPLPPPVQVAANDVANVSPAPSAAGESEVLADDEVFAAVFTPTADEDQLI